jgi:hypothetical protein
MEGLRLIFDDETVIENGRAGYSSGFLWLWMPGFSMQDAAMIAFNTEKTANIVFQYGEMQDEYEGFTNCIRIIAEENEIAVCLTKG